MSEYIPLTALPSASDLDPDRVAQNIFPPLSWSFSLPPRLDIERLEVNMSALKRYHAVGAMAGSVVLEHQGERSEFTPNVSGINADGSAIATKAGYLQKVDRSKNDIIDPHYVPESLRSNIGKPLVLHNLNKAESAQRVSSAVQEKRKGREQAWACELDTSLRESFRRAGKIHLQHRVPAIFNFMPERDKKSVTKFLHASEYLAWPAVVSEGVRNLSENAVSQSGSIALVAGLWVSLAGYQALRTKDLTGSLLLSERRWSIFWSQQSDRYLALNGISRASRLIRARK